MTVCTIFVIACLSCPCFLESRSTCSFIKFQSFAFFAIVTMAVMIREVEARSEAWFTVSMWSCARRFRTRVPGGSSSQERAAGRCRLGDCPLSYVSTGFPQACDIHTAPSFSASGIATSASFVKSLSALRTSPLGMVAGLLCVVLGRLVGIPTFNSDRGEELNAEVSKSSGVAQMGCLDSCCGSSVM